MSERPNLGDAAQIRMIVEQVVEATIIKIKTETPVAPAPREHTELPPPLKWAATIIAGLFTAGIATLAFWIVSTLSEMQVTVARIDERQQLQAGDIDGKFQEHDRRITTLEGFHRTGAKQ